jgi:sugar phosphate isomerase/epimerase
MSGIFSIADNMPLDTLIENELTLFREAARAAHVEIEVGMRGLKPELLTRYIELAVFFNSKILRIITDMNGYEPTKDAVVSILKDFEPKFRKNNVTLAIENHDRFTSRELVQILDAVGSDAIGICLDTVNSVGAGEGLETIIDNLGPYSVNLHVKDFSIKRVPYLMGFVVEGCPAGRGMLNVPKLLKKMSDCGKDPNAIIELWTPPEENIIDTVTKEEMWVEESVKYLRGLILT